MYVCTYVCSKQGGRLIEQDRKAQKQSAHSLLKKRVAVDDFLVQQNAWVDACEERGVGGRRQIENQ